MTGEPGDGTRAVHAGRPAAVRGAPMMPGPVFASGYHLAGAGDGADGYARPDQPTWRAYEAALADLEGAPSLVFASGMAAISAVLLTVLRPGDTLVLPSDGYYTTRDLARSHLRELGVTVREVPTAGPYDQLAGARLVLLESPANPGLDVCDIAAVSAAAHRVGALVAVDNTTATPLGQRPLDLGADLVVSSDTKALTGHSDLLLGHLATRDPDLLARLTTWRTRTGGIAGPFETWLAHRSLGTLDLRLARQEECARAVHAALAGRPEVTGLRWPGAPGDPSHAVAARQMRRFGGVLSFVLPSADVVDRVVAASRLITAATSFGGLHTTLDRRAQWGGDAVPPGFVRLSAGCEDPDDLVADLLGALDTATR